jgi:hypothetical protein
VRCCAYKSGTYSLVTKRHVMIVLAIVGIVLGILDAFTFRLMGALCTVVGVPLPILPNMTLRKLGDFKGLRWALRECPETGGIAVL